MHIDAQISSHVIAREAPAAACLPNCSVHATEGDGRHRCNMEGRSQGQQHDRLRSRRSSRVAWSPMVPAMHEEQLEETLLSLSIELNELQSKLFGEFGLRKAPSRRR